MKIDGVKKFREQQIQAMTQTFKERFEKLMEEKPIEIKYFEKSQEQE